MKSKQPGHIENKRGLNLLQDVMCGIMGKMLWFICFAIVIIVRLSEGGGRLLQKGYSSVMATIMDEAAVEEQRQKTQAALHAAATFQPQQAQVKTPQVHQVTMSESKLDWELQKQVLSSSTSTNSCSSPDYNLNCNIDLQEKKSAAAAAAVFQGVFCRYIAVVGNLLSQAHFNRPIPVKYEALSC